MTDQRHNELLAKLDRKIRFWESVATIAHVGGFLAVVLWLALLATQVQGQRYCPGGTCPSDGWTAPVQSRPASLSTNIDRKVVAASCRIRVAGDGSTGSGTLISRNDSQGLVITCGHLFRDSQRGITVSFPDGKRYQAHLVDVDHRNDLAALLIRRPQAEPLPVYDSRPSGWLTAIGFGGSGRLRAAKGQVVDFVTARGADGPSAVIQVGVRGGDSGGGVVDSQGRLTGVIWGCRRGQTYLTCGRPLRRFLGRVWPDRRQVADADDGKATLSWRQENEQAIQALKDRLADLEAQISARSGDTQGEQRDGDDAARLRAEFQEFQADLKAEIKAELAGALGPRGPKGPPGDDATVDYQRLASEIDYPTLASHVHQAVSVDIDTNQLADDVAKRMPPIHMRVSPDAPYQSVSPGQYVTLPLNRVQ